MGTVRKTSESAEVRGVIHQFPVGPVKSPERGEVEAVDRAGITANARELNRALNIVVGAPEGRAERVAALREQIANGTYTPDPRDVARAILKRGL